MKLNYIKTFEGHTGKSSADDLLNGLLNGLLKIFDKKV